MRITFTPSAWEDYLWIQENDRKLLKRINLLIETVRARPLRELGSPNHSRASYRAIGHGALLKNIVWSIAQPLLN